jgi:hypothetical protein
VAIRLPTLVPRDDREGRVLEVWKGVGGLGDRSIANYLVWVRRYRAYWCARGLDEIDRLTLPDVVAWAVAYVGVRRGRRVTAFYRLGARHALHAWSCALRSLGVAVPSWRPPPVAPRQSALIMTYVEYRRSHRGAAARTLARDAAVVSDFLAVLRSRGRRVARAGIADIDAFIDWMSTRLGRRTIADNCSVLRGFLRFLRATGRLQVDLAPFVAAPRFRADERPPRALPWPDIRRILRSV